MPRTRIPAPDPTAAQVRLMESAERLIARHGLDGASTRAITREAGHGNHSAVAHWFGDRQGLLDSLYGWRSAPINEERLALMQRLVAEGRERDPEGLTRAFVEPYAASLAQRHPSYWARYTVALLDQRPFVFMGWVENDLDQRFSGVEVPLRHTMDLLRLMRKVAAGGQEPTAGLRVAVIIRSINAMMAAWERDDELGLEPRLSLSQVADEAIAFGTGALNA